MIIEKAKITDAEQIHELVNYFAEKGEMLPRALSDIYQGLRDYYVVRDDDNKLVACVALHVSWGDLAEIRSLAVDPNTQLKGLGSMLVKACVEEARTLDIPAIFCLTYKQPFFEKLGFHLVDKTKLPRKVWSECFHCPKFPDCDEVSMIMRLIPEPKRDVEAVSRTLSSQQIYDGRAIKVRVDTVITAAGHETTREIVEHVDCIVAVPVDKENNVILVQQYREAVGKKLLELPAGGIDPGEDPIECVRRELQEEIGYLPRKVRKIGGFYPSPGYNTGYLYLFTARNLTPSRLVAEDTEEIDVVRVPVEKIPQLLESGDITDAKTIIGLMRFLEIDKKRRK
jgi:amino-acid N-acetyltransferase